VRVEPLRSPGPIVRVLPGLDAQTSAITHVADVERLARLPAKVAQQIKPPGQSRGEGIGLRLHGLLRVPADGVYTLTVRASGPAWLTMASRRVAGTEAKRSGVIGLRKGLHELVLVLAHLRGKPELRLSWSGAGVEAGEVPAAALCRPDPSASVAPVVWPAGGADSGPVIVSVFSPSRAPLRYTTRAPGPT